MFVNKLAIIRLTDVLYPRICQYHLLLYVALLLSRKELLSSFSLWRGLQCAFSFSAMWKKLYKIKDYLRISKISVINPVKARENPPRSWHVRDKWRHTIGYGSKNINWAIKRIWDFYVSSFLNNLCYGLV